MKRGKWYWGLISIALVTLLAANAGCVTVVAPDQTASPSGFITYNDTTNGFSISYPKDWEKIPQTLIGGVESLLGGAGNIIVGFWAPAKAEYGFTPNFTVAKASLPYEQNLEAGYEEIKLVAEQEEGYAFISKDYMTIDGISAIKYVYRSSEISDSTQMYILLMQGKVAWLITLSCAPQSFNSLESTFDTIANSFHIPGAATTASPTPPTTIQSGFLTYNDTTNGFSISYPKDWERAPQDITPDDALIGFRSLGTTRTMLLVYKSFLPYVDNLQTAYEDMKTVHEAEAGYLFISKDDITIDGIPGFKYVFQVDFNGSPSTLVYVYLVQGNSDWLVQLGCTPAQSYTQYKSTFDTIINSFHISGAATSTPPPVTSAPSSGLLTYTDNIKGFSIAYPKDWEKTPQELFGEDVIVGFYKGIDQADPSVYTVSVFERSSGMTVEDFYGALRPEFETWEDYSFIAKNNLTINGIAAIKYTFVYRNEGNLMKVMLILLAKDNSAWLLTFGSSPEYFATHESTFNTIASSFKIIDTIKYKE